MSRIQGIGKSTKVKIADIVAAIEHLDARTLCNRQIVQYSTDIDVESTDQDVPVAPTKPPGRGGGRGIGVR